jgi:hypothetical protein
VRGFGVEVFLAPFPQAIPRSEEHLDADIGCMAMKLSGGVPAHEMLGTQPYALMPYRALERGQRLAVEPHARASSSSCSLVPIDTQCI